MPHSVASLTIPVDSAKFGQAAAWLHEFCAAHEVPAECCHGLDICLDEVLANVIRHGGEAARALPVELGLELAASADQATLALSVSAGGIPFDPCAYQPAPPPASLADAEPGGLGILMMRSHSTSMSYRRTDERNLTCFSVAWGSGAVAA